MARLLLILTTAAISAGAGYLAYETLVADGQAAGESSSAVGVGGEPPPDRGPGQVVGQRRPEYTLGSVDGSRISASDFDGKVVLVNFWATWCAPCREEMPMLMELREALRGEGLEVVGVALDDVQRARDFVAELEIEYPNLVGSTDVMAMMQVYGNTTGTLPYSVLVDSNGIIRWTRLGVLERSVLEAEIRALLEQI